MSRTLTEEDIRLLEKLAPECTSLTCTKSAAEYRSILAPVANHFAKDADDFASRLLRLTDEEFSRIIAMIRSGEESIGCLPVECAEILISETMKRGDMNAANELYALYEMGGGCG